jgi:CRP-like cAMP-binding protein
MADDGLESGEVIDSLLPKKSIVLGEWIFEEGSKADAAYLILEGSVEIFRGEGTKQVGIAMLKRGDIFGELSLIDGKPRAASARATQDSKLLVIRLEDMESRLDHLEKSDRVLRRLIGVFVARLRGQLDRRI